MVGMVLNLKPTRPPLCLPRNEGGDAFKRWWRVM